MGPTEAMLRHGGRVRCRRGLLRHATRNRESFLQPLPRRRLQRSIGAPLHFSCHVSPRQVQPENLPPLIDHLEWALQRRRMFPHNTLPDGLRASFLCQRLRGALHASDLLAGAVPDMRAELSRVDGEASSGVRWHFRATAGGCREVFRGGTDVRRVRGLDKLLWHLCCVLAGDNR